MPDLNHHEHPAVKESCRWRQHRLIIRDLSLGQARRLQLAAQGLLQPPRRQAPRDDVIAAIEQMRLLQIDTIHVVARSPYLVLHARLGDYPMAWLDEALAEGQLAECWAHEACFVSAADFAWHGPARASARTIGRIGTPRACIASSRQQMDALLGRIRASGAGARRRLCAASGAAAQRAGGSGSRRSAGWRRGSRWAS